MTANPCLKPTRIRTPDIQIQTLFDKTDAPVVTVSFFRILTVIHPLPNGVISDTPSSNSRIVKPNAQKMIPSPVPRRESLSNQVCSVDSSSKATRRFRCFHHNGELKR